MKSILKIALGIIAALGGFLDIGDLVFNTQAGALYRYDLLWAVVLGTLGIAVYAEMCGRVAAVTQRPVFDVIRMRLGFGMGLVALIASTLVNLLTVAAELGGLAIILQLLFDAEFSLFVVLAAIGLVIVVALLPFGGIERIFGYCGLMMLVFVATAIHQGPDWGEVAHGFIPSFSGSTLYLYFVVGVFAAALMPYEVHFYSSGAIEEGWDRVEPEREPAQRDRRLRPRRRPRLRPGRRLRLPLPSARRRPGRPRHGRPAGPGRLRRDRPAAGARRNDVLRRRRRDRLQLLRLLQPRPVPRLGVGALPRARGKRRASPSPG